MLLTITTTHRPATDLGFLLHKHPDRVQRFSQSVGTAVVFYPEASEERCTAALLLEVDPIALARSRGRSSPDFSLGQYVNDRSYAASSLLAVALGKAFSTARSGRCDSRQEVADSPIPLEICLPVLPCRGGPDIPRRIFEPLGWEVETTPIPLDAAFPEWGDSRYVRLRLTGSLRLADALNQLHVLLPALDESKHYWQDVGEIDKLLRSGEGWLATHPDRALITRRYLGRGGGMARAALERLAELDEVVAADGSDGLAFACGADPDDAEEAALPDARRIPLNRQRHDAVVEAIARLGAVSVIDLGCGPGQMLSLLVQQPGLSRIVGVDVSSRSLEIAAKRLHLDRATERQAERLQLLHGALTYEDERFAGFDVAVLMEVIEHVDLPRLAALEHVVFGAARPGAVIVTTPNREFNVRYVDLTGHRHPDHRFEWDRPEFAAWVDRVATAHGYHATITGVGETDPDLGTPTQMAVFTRDH